MKYLFFDTAINGYYTLILLQKEFPNYMPLISPEEKISDDVAPFIFEMDDEKLAVVSKADHASLQKIILFESDLPLAAVQNYYTKFVVQKLNGKPFYFRFWASNVLKKFLATCDTDQLKEFFGSVQKFICEDEDPAYTLTFSFDGKKLVTKKANTGSAFACNQEAVAAEVSPTVSNDNSDNKPDTAPQEKKPRRFIY